jgi:hypothetical protein
METYTDMFHRIYFLIERPEHQLADPNREFTELGRDNSLNDPMKSRQKAMNRSCLGYVHRLILMKCRIRYEEPRKIQFSDLSSKHFLKATKSVSYSFQVLFYWIIACGIWIQTLLTLVPCTTWYSPFFEATTSPERSRSMSPLVGVSLFVVHVWSNTVSSNRPRVRFRFVFSLLNSIAQFYHPFRKPRSMPVASCCDIGSSQLRVQSVSHCVFGIIRFARA